MKNDTTVLFCSNPTCIRYIVDILTAAEDGAEFIICVTHEPSARFLRELALSVPVIELLPGAGSRLGPLGVVRARSRLRRCHERLRRAQVRAAVFFTNYYDWMTFGLLNRLGADGCVLQMYDIFEVNRPRRVDVGLRQHLRTTLIHAVAGPHIVLTGTGDQWIPTYDCAAAGVNVLAYGPLHAMPQSMQYSPRTTDRPRALLFEGCDGEVFGLPGYDAALRTVLAQLLAQGFHIVVKPHPRLGCSPFLADYSSEVIPGHVPSEFLPFAEFDLILGVATAALGKASQAGVRTVSLVRALFAADDPRRGHYQEYLSGLSSTIEFPDSAPEVLDAVLSQAPNR